MTEKRRFEIVCFLYKEKVALMSSLTRFVRALSVVSLAVVLVSQVRSVSHAVFVTVLVSAVILVGPSFTLGTGGQLIAMAFSALGGVLVTSATVSPLDDGRPALVEGFAMVATALFCASSVRRSFKSTFGDLRADLAFDAFAIVACTQVRLHPVALCAMASWLASSLAGLRADGADRGSLRRAPRRFTAIFAVMLLSTAAVTVLSSRAIKGLYAWASARMLHALEDDTVSGFDDGFDLGALSSLLRSEALVLRVRGPSPEYLRGSAFDRYHHGRWRSSRGFANRVVRVPRGPLHGPEVVSVTRVGGVGSWYFLPLETKLFATEDGSARSDSLGTVRAIPGDPGDRWWFTVGARSELAPSPPGPKDSDVPAELSERLRGLALGFSHGVSGHDAVMTALSDALRRRYRYSLHFERGPGDPVIDFLFVHREGHCEYFASALALLGRSVGVPTRVVGGYRVAERNPFTDEWVVREMNAHAWVEAWGDDQRWHSFDATPAGAVSQNQRHQTRGLRALREAFVVWLAAGRRWLAARTTAELLGAAGVLLFVWVIYRKITNVSSLPGPPIAYEDLPLESLKALEDALAERGLERGVDETLERFAARVRDTPMLSTETRETIAEQISRYASWRYGGEGEKPKLEAELTAVTKVLLNEKI